VAPKGFYSFSIRQVQTSAGLEFRF
jgi:hypothetical protein